MQSSTRRHPIKPLFDTAVSRRMSVPVFAATATLLAGCAENRRPADELLVNGDFTRGTQPWRSDHTINVAGVFSTWRPDAGRGKSGAIEISVDPSAGAATPTWTCDIPEAPRGRSVTITGYVRGVAVAGSPGLDARAWSVGRASVLAEVNTETTQLPLGTFEWTPLVAVLDVPDDAAALELLLFLRGPGTVWFDDLSVRVEPKPTPDSHDRD